MRQRDRGNFDKGEARLTGEVATEAVNLSVLIAAAAPSDVAGSMTGPAITGITCSSSEVTPGACFVAIRGRREDGHTYIPEVLERGAALIVGEDAAPESLPADRTYLRVEDSRRALGALAA